MSDTPKSASSTDEEPAAGLDLAGSDIPPGFLADTQIRALLDRDMLIENGSWDADCVRHASYTIRFGTKAEHRTRDDGNLRLENLNANSQPVRIEPGQTTLLYSIEHLRIPDDVLAFTVARGLLFVEGLAPENTYVDPGFRGVLYTTVTNISDRIIEIPVGCPVARLFFFHLAEPCGKPYKPGAALGIDQQLATISVLEGDAATGMTELDRAALESVLTAGGPIGRSTAEIVRRARVANMRLMVLAVAWPVLLVLANSEWAQKNLWGFGANVIASLLAAVIVMATPNVLRGVLK